ncbi:N-6 DNA methylase [candidate division WOR-3 bacterium]|nr:N-6 DNA methylase [candidate division WOR-3 bacterium]
MGQVEVATDKAEETIKAVAGDRGVYLFEAKPDTFGGNEIAETLTKIWTRIYHHAKIDKFFDVTLAVLERREDDYMRLIEGINADALKGYTEMFGTLAAYFIDGNYSDPLGTFYIGQFRSKMGGEFYTPFHVAYCMAEMMNPKPDDVMLDPCCGSGVMFLATRCVIHKNYGWIASSRYGRNMYGVDISSDAVKMAKINMFMTDHIFMSCLFIDGVSEWVNKQKA